MNDAFIDPLFEVEWLDRAKKIVVDEMYLISFCYVTQGKIQIKLDALKF